LRVKAINEDGGQGKNRQPAGGVDRGSGVLEVGQTQGKG